MFYAFRAVAEERDRKVRADLERMRLQTLYLINIHLPKEKSIRDVRAFMPFGWDPEYIPEEVHIPTPDEWDELDRKYADKIK